jgi:hypothetical protein
MLVHGQTTPIVTPWVTDVQTDIYGQQSHTHLLLFHQGTQLGICTDAVGRYYGTDLWS